MSDRGYNEQGNGGQPHDNWYGDAGQNAGRGNGGGRGGGRGGRGGRGGFAPGRGVFAPGRGGYVAGGAGDGGYGSASGHGGFVAGGRARRGGADGGRRGDATSRGHNSRGAVQKNRSRPVRHQRRRDNTGSTRLRDVPDILHQLEESARPNLGGHVVGVDDVTTASGPGRDRPMEDPGRALAATAREHGADMSSALAVAGGIAAAMPQNEVGRRRVGPNMLFGLLETEQFGRTTRQVMDRATTVYGSAARIRSALAITGPGHHELGRLSRNTQKIADLEDMLEDEDEDEEPNAPVEETEEEVCGSCSLPGHRVARCRKLINGVVVGCARCNDGSHHTEACPMVPGGPTVPAWRNEMFRLYVESRWGLPSLSAENYDWVTAAMAMSRGPVFGYPMPPVCAGL